MTTGHVSSFSDPLLDCRACKSRHRADKLISECEQGKGVDVDAMTFDEMDAFIASHDEVVCPVCGKHDFTPIRKFNLMFKTAIGVTEDSSSTCYLRPETAQGIFCQLCEHPAHDPPQAALRRLPGRQGVPQRDHAGNFTFRTREFEQMECEFFCKPDTDLEWFAYWKDYCKNWLLSLGIQEENLSLRDHEPAELAFYSRATTDIEYAFLFTDWGELWGTADRTNYDLSRHQEASGKSLEYFDPETNEHYIPYVIEPSLGCDRVALAFLCEAYDEQHLVDAKGQGGCAHRAAPAPPIWHRSSAPCCPCPRSWAIRRWRSATSWPRTLWSTMTMPAPSASVTAVRTRSAPRCASPWDFRLSADDKGRG